MSEVNNRFLIEKSEQMFRFFREGVVGTKEFRNWLAKVDETFKEVRDADVDNEIDTLARQRRLSMMESSGSKNED